MTASDKDWLAVVGNPGKARRSWGRLSWVLGWEGADVRVSRTFYIARGFTEIGYVPISRVIFKFHR